MNIRQAKEYIKQTVRLYLKKNDLGDYRIPVVRQRPIFMLGAPGVGKTAIMEQIAQELGIALVSYSMTHHTRQSAIGLPFIRRKSYMGIEADVTEYTMSEIIASVYDTMDESGIKEGILFLDEINCVSETLYPSMLQFLQYKIFGRHRVPEGWVIVTAGNPPEFNKSVREFDVAVLDRLKVLDVQPDYSVFREYAGVIRLHPAITSFLDMKREYFYKIGKTARGRSYVTARGWEDLSEILCLYESEGLKADDELIGQYLNDETVVREFGAFYELYNKYRRDYHVNEILEGTTGDEVCERARAAAFDERLSLLSMLMDKVISDIRDSISRSDYVTAAAPLLRACSDKSDAELTEKLESMADSIRGRLLGLGKAGALSPEEEDKQKHLVALIEELNRKSLANERSYDFIKGEYNKVVSSLKQESEKAGRELHNLFAFCEKAFGTPADEGFANGGGNEMLILVTELTVNPYSAKFIARFGSSDYEKHQRELMITERRINMQEEARDLLAQLE